MTSLRIAVDASPLCHPGTGIYRYTYELLKRMCPMGGEWFFYSLGPYDESDFCLPNVNHRMASLPAGFRVSQLGQLISPLRAKRDQVDVFWSPRHQLPLLLPDDIRTVVTIHDLVWWRCGDTMRFPGRQIESFFMPRSVRMADEIVAVSEFTRSELGECFSLDKERVQLVSGASYITSYGIGDSVPTTEPASYFLFVGTMEPRKNLPRLLRAYRRYVDDCEAPLALKIVGGRGWGGVNVSQIIDQLDLGAYAEVLGSVDQQKLSSLYFGAHALVMPSLYEGFGLPVAESLSAGVPVITSRNSAMSEVAGTAGLFVDPLSQEDIFSALLRMSEDSTLHGELAAQTSAASQRYDWGRSASKMFALLRGSTSDE